jgi:uracil-DNA glycosylase
LKAVLALGRAAFDAYIDRAPRLGASTKGTAFAHGRRRRPTSTLYASYRPSPRNTRTGKLTSKRLVSLLEARKKRRRARKVYLMPGQNRRHAAQGSRER